MEETNSNDELFLSKAPIYGSFLISVWVILLMIEEYYTIWVDEGIMHNFFASEPIPSLGYRYLSIPTLIIANLLLATTLFFINRKNTFLKRGSIIALILSWLLVIPIILYVVAWSGFTG